MIFTIHKTPSWTVVINHTHSHISKTTCWRRSGKIWTIVTGSPEVKLTPYMGAVVLKVDLHSLAGVNSLSGTQVWGLGVELALDSALVPLLLTAVASVELSSAINENQVLVVFWGQKPTNGGTLVGMAGLALLTIFIYTPFSCLQHTCKCIII